MAPTPNPVQNEVAGGAPSVGRRERRRREVRDRLYDTAIELFLEQGYEHTTMDEIADRADVARTTVFNHYPRKLEFLHEWGARRRAKVTAVLHQSHLDDKPIDVVLESYMRAMAALNESHRAETMELMPHALGFSSNNPPMGQALARYVRRARRRGEIRDEVDPAQAGLMLAATYFATLVSWSSIDPAPFDLTAALTAAARLLLRGIAPATPAPER